MKAFRLFVLSMFVVMANGAFADEAKGPEVEIEASTVIDQENFLSKLTEDQRLIFDAMSEDFQEAVMEMSEFLSPADALQSIMDENHLAWVDGKLEEVASKE